VTAPNDPPTLGGVPFPPCVEVATDRRTAPIIGIPFDLKPCPIEELSPEMIEAAKAAEREAHPLRVVSVNDAGESTSYEACGAIDGVFGPDCGPVCTEPKGHDGDHVAVDFTQTRGGMYPGGTVVSRWGQS